MSAALFGPGPRGGRTSAESLSMEGMVGPLSF